MLSSCIITMPSKIKDIQIKILFEGEPEDITTFSAPTIFTRQRLRASLTISHDGTHTSSFDAVQIVLKGTPFYRALCARLILTSISRENKDRNQTRRWSVLAD